MNIRVNEQLYENVEVINHKDQVLMTSDLKDKKELISNVIKSDAIQILDTDNTLISTIQGVFIYDCLMRDRSGEYLVFHKKIDTPKDTIAKLNEQITDIELALCEIYESLGV